MYANEPRAGPVERPGHRHRAATSIRWACSPVRAARRGLHRLTRNGCARWATTGKCSGSSREEDPPSPSTRLEHAGPDSGDGIGRVAAERSQAALPAVAWRARLDRHEGLAREGPQPPLTRRPSSLARDVDRYLNDEPVLACPPSSWYRFRKFTRRHQARAADQPRRRPWCCCWRAPGVSLGGSGTRASASQRAVRSQSRDANKPWSRGADQDRSSCASERLRRRPSVTNRPGGGRRGAGRLWFQAEASLDPGRDRSENRNGRPPPPRAGAGRAIADWPATRAGAADGKAAAHEPGWRLSHSADRAGSQHRVAHYPSM